MLIFDPPVFHMQKTHVEPLGILDIIQILGM